MFGIDYLKVITPLLLHVAVTQLVVMTAGKIGDTTTLTTLTAVIVIPICGFMFWNDRRQVQKAEETKKTKVSIVVCVGCLLAGGLLNWGWSWILEALHFTEHFSNATQEALLSGEFVLQLVGLGIFVPVAEELVFRALIFQRMKKLMPATAAILLSSLLFAVYHGNIIQMVYAFPIALIITTVYAKGKHFAYPVCIHVGANMLTIISMLF